MFYPSLTFLVCLAAPLVALLPPRKGDIWRAYTLTSVPLFIAATLSTDPDRNTAVLQLSPGQVSELQLPVYVPVAVGTLLMVCAAVLWLQARKDALPYPRLARWLALPLSLAAASAVPSGYAVAFLAVVKWAFAPVAIKAMAIAGAAGLGLAALALVAFLGQLAVGVARAALRAKGTS